MRIGRSVPDHEVDIVDPHIIGKIYWDEREEIKTPDVDAQFRLANEERQMLDVSTKIQGVKDMGNILEKMKNFILSPALLIKVLVWILKKVLEKLNTPEKVHEAAIKLDNKFDMPFVEGEEEAEAWLSIVIYGVKYTSEFLDWLMQK